MLWLKIINNQCTIQILGNRANQLLCIQIPLQLKVPVRLCLKATAWSWNVLFSFQLYRLSFILILFVPSKLVSFSLNLTSVCLRVFSENCFCIAQFLMETEPQRIYTRVAYNLLFSSAVDVSSVFRNLFMFSSKFQASRFH